MAYNFNPFTGTLDWWDDDETALDLLYVNTTGGDTMEGSLSISGTGREQIIFTGAGSASHTIGVKSGGSGDLDFVFQSDRNIQFEAGGIIDPALALSNDGTTVTNLMHRSYEFLLDHQTHTSDLATQTFKISGQSALASATVNQDGGSMYIYAGAKATAGGVDGNLYLGYDGSAGYGDVLIPVSDLGVNATRVNKGWFTDLEISNMPTVGGTSLADTFLDEASNLSDVADQQTAIDNVTAVAGATDEYVLTKDTASGNAVWKVTSAGGAVDTFGVPVANDFARFTDLDTIEGRSYAETKADLSLEIGTDVQAWDNDLDDIAALTPTLNNFMIGDGVDWALNTPAQAVTALGLDAGGAGDIWFEKAGDTVTGVYNGDDTTNSTSTITGSIHTDGGLGVAKDVYFGLNLNLVNTSSATTGTIEKENVRFMHNFRHPTGNTARPAGENVFLGEGAGNFLMGSTATSTNHGSKCVGIGSNALRANTTGYQNFALGSGALDDNTTGLENIAMGVNTMSKNKTGNTNIAIGREAMNGVNNASNCSRNTIIGRRAAFAVLTGADDNTSIGYQSLTAVTTGATNTAIGGLAGDNLTTGSNNTIIGYGLDAQSITADNQLSIGNLIFSEGIDGTGTGVSSGNIGIGVTDPDQKLEVAGGLHTAGAIISLYTAKTATYTVSVTDHIIDCTANTFTLTLPTATTAGQEFIIKNSGTGIITVDGDGTETIDGNLTAVLAVQYGSITVLSNGANWILI